MMSCQDSVLGLEIAVKQEERGNVADWSLFFTVELETHMWHRMCPVAQRLYSCSHSMGERLK
jgi:hypothetical protein